MEEKSEKITIWTNRVAALSILLLFFNIPHSLEDFTLGEPAKAGIPMFSLAYLVAGLIAIQGLALFWTGQRKLKGYVIHAVLGLLWPLFAGSAQLPVILQPGPYRSGSISEFLVIGIIVVGLLLLYASIRAWSASRKNRVHA